MKFVEAATVPGPLSLLYSEAVRNEFTAIIQQTEGWFLALSPEMPAANGQGRTRDEALESLASAIDLVLQDLREESLSQLPPGAERAVVTVG